MHKNIVAGTIQHWENTNQLIIQTEVVYQKHIQYLQRYLGCVFPFGSRPADTLQVLVQLWNWAIALNYVVLCAGAEEQLDACSSSQGWPSSLILTHMSENVCNLILMFLT